MTFQEPSDAPTDAPDRHPGRSKRTVGDLAIFGGPMLFDEQIHVGRPNLGDRDRFFELLGNALDERRLTNDGPLVQAFEARVAGMTRARHAIAVVNATIGLQIAAKATGLEGEVIVPSFTFVATPHALDWIGLEPRFGDIEATRLTLDAAVLDPLVGPRTSAIMATHVWGRTCDTDAIATVARRHGLRLLYDAAHAFGCDRDGQPVGTFGDAEVFSFHATKFVNAFEGGVITTDDDGIAERARLLRNFGFAGPATLSGGTNGKMHEASAAMGLTSLDALDDFVAINRRNDALYRQELAGIEGLTPMSPDDRGACNAQHVIVRVDRDAAPISRDSLSRVLWAENVLARRYFHPGCHRLAPYVERPATRTVPLPQTERATAETLVLPTGTGISEPQIEALGELVRFTFRHASAIERRLAEPARSASSA